MRNRAGDKRDKIKVKLRHTEGEGRRAKALMKTGSQDLCLEWRVLNIWTSNKMKW